LSGIYRGNGPTEWLGSSPCGMWSCCIVRGDAWQLRSHMLQSPLVHLRIKVSGPSPRFFGHAWPLDQLRCGSLVVILLSQLETRADMSPSKSHEFMGVLKGLSNGPRYPCSRGTVWARRVLTRLQTVINIVRWMGFLFPSRKQSDSVRLVLKHASSSRHQRYTTGRLRPR
jgi:hypothetical protein